MGSATPPVLECSISTQLLVLKIVQVLLSPLSWGTGETCSLAM
ncbi:hypothetical protein NC652_003843 [Populus alba x Populus x berolinensis]|nr:hypothetical protein NC652_003843 [Populus alba x Populus x berolinensis]